jgi:casein kinase II subunit beta
MDKKQYMSSDDESDSSRGWVEWFLSQRGNELFSAIDESYILDRFNLAGLNTEVQNYQLALDLITDSLEHDLDPHTWEVVERSARHLYGLIHARWVVTNKGLTLMADKYRRKEFGRCPRVLCEDQPVIPVGLRDVSGVMGVKLYCPKCEDVYIPTSKKHLNVDGAYFTTSLPHLILEMFPNLIPQRPVDRYVPKIFGFKVHRIAELHRQQDRFREELAQKTKSMMIFEE